MPDADRLPWLSDDIQPVGRPRTGLLLSCSLAAAALAGGAAYWLGSDRSAAPQAPTEMREARSNSTTPAATAAGTAPAQNFEPEPAPVQSPLEEIEPAPLRQVQPAAEPAPVTIRTVEAPAIVEPAPVAIAASEPTGTLEDVAAATDVTPALEGPPLGQIAPAPPAIAQKTQPAVGAPLRPWPAAQSAGAAGRMVRVGTFASRYQAKRAWWRVVRTYPGVRRLKAVVVPVASLRNGRTYYRLQFGTTSHAHSVVLCQRMRIVGQSCVPVGLPSEQSPA